MNAHTKGPWTVTTEVDKDGDERHTIRAESNGAPLAVLEGYNGHEREANANLIVAALDMLAALDQVANGVLMRDGINHHDNGLLELADKSDCSYTATNLRRLHLIVAAAISKATGEQS